MNKCKIRWKDELMLTYGISQAELAGLFDEADTAK